VPVDIETAEPREFLPYGTPCNEIADPILARLCELEREIKQLRDEAKARTVKETPVRSKRA
jgi:serine O-acetyltransferase